MNNSSGAKACREQLFRSKRLSWTTLLEQMLVVNNSFGANACPVEPLIVWQTYFLSDYSFALLILGSWNKWLLACILKRKNVPQYFPWYLCKCLYIFLYILIIIYIYIHYFYFKILKKKEGNPLNKRTLTCVKRMSQHNLLNFDSILCYSRRNLLMCFLLWHYSI